MVSMLEITGISDVFSLEISLTKKKKKQKTITEHVPSVIAHLLLIGPSAML